MAQMLRALPTHASDICLQCLGHTGFAPIHGVCAFPVYTAQAPGCSAGELSKAGLGFRVLPRSQALGFRFSGTPQKHRLGWACILCPSQVQAAQVMRCLANAVAATYRLPAARFSGCTTGTPSQADVDHPEPQEVLVSKEACLHFRR